MNYSDLRDAVDVVRDTPPAESSLGERLVSGYNIEVTRYNVADFSASRLLPTNSLSTFFDNKSKMGQGMLPSSHFYFSVPLSIESSFSNHLD